MTSFNQAGRHRVLNKGLGCGKHQTLLTGLCMCFGGKMWGILIVNEVVYMNVCVCARSSRNTPEFAASACAVVKFLRI